MVDFTSLPMTLWIIAVDGHATDIRESTALAVRQARVRKATKPNATVTLHYGPARTRTYHDANGALQCEVIAQLGESTHIATIHG